MRVIYKGIFHVTIIVFCSMLSGCNESEPVSELQDDAVFKPDTVLLDDRFDAFPNEAVPKVLRELKICDVYVDTAEKLVLPCDHNLFRAFRLQDGMSFQEGFIVDVKPGVIPGTNTRRCFVVRYTGQRYRIVNDLKGSLLEFHTTQSGYPDMVLRYLDSRVGKVTVMHRWSDTHGAYLPSAVTELNNRFVKPEFVDSLNKVYLTDFVWGY